MGDSDANQGSVNKQAVLDRVLADGRKSLRQNFAVFKNQGNGYNQSNKLRGGGMGSDKSIIATELEEKLKKIEERLSQIAGYRFIPPSIKEEKESLEKERESLQKTAEGLRLKAEGQPADLAEGLAGESGVEEEEEEREAQGGLTADRSDDLTSSQEEANTEEEELEPWKTPSGADTHRPPFSADSERADSQISDREEKELDANNDDEEVITEGGSGDSFGRAAGLIRDLKSKLSRSETPDKKYLEGVISSLERAIDYLKNRVGVVQMDDEQKEQAIRGRLALYLSTPRAEFEFSDLLDDNLRRQFADLTKEQE